MEKKKKKEIEYPKFKESMVKTHTILIPNMLPIHMSLFEQVLLQSGYKVEIMRNEGPEVVSEGLKYVHNDTCYPALLVIGQFIDNALFYILALAPGFGLGGFVNPAVRFDTWAHLFTVVGFTTLIELGVELIFTPVFHKFTQFLINKKDTETCICNKE